MCVIMIDNYQKRGNPFVYILHCTEIISLERIKSRYKEEIEMEEVKLGMICIPHQILSG